MSESTIAGAGAQPVPHPPAVTAEVIGQVMACTTDLALPAGHPTRGVEASGSRIAPYDLQVGTGTPHDDPPPPDHPTDTAPAEPTIADWATYYRGHGFALARVAPGDKQATARGWPGQSAGPWEFAPGDNIAIKTGSMSDTGRPGHALVCVDLDSPAAVGRGDEYLPPTGMVEGRPGKPRSHRYFLVPVDTIPDWAVSRAEQSAAAAVRAGRHPGPWTKHFRTPDGKCAIDFLGTGAVAVVPPAVHESGECRKWEGGLPGVPPVVPFPDLWESVVALAAAVECLPPSGAPGTTGARESVVTSARPVGGATANLSSRAGRAAAYLRAIPDDDLSRSGHGGHNTCFRHLIAAAHGFGVADPGELTALFEEAYNARLKLLAAARPGEGFEVWSPAELLHKVRDVLAAGPPPGKPPGWLLAGGPTVPADPPRSWDDPALLAGELAERMTVRFIKDMTYRYDGRRYQVLSDGALESAMRTRAEAAAEHEHHQKVVQWDAGPGAEVGELRRLLAPSPTVTSYPVDRSAVERKVAALERDRPKAVPKVTRAHVFDALQSFRARGRLPDDTAHDVWLPDGSPRPWVAVENGLLDLGNRVLMPHTPDWFSLTAIGIGYDPDAPDPEKWLRFLVEVTAGDAAKAALLEEVLGWCLDRGSGVQAVAALVGPGANGKSVFFEVLRLLLGDANCAAVPIAQLTGNRFAAYGMLGKLANVSADEAHLEVGDVSALKALTGGDLYPFEAKNKQTIFAVNRCKLLFGCNALPPLRDRSDGIWRRLVPVPLTWVVPEGQRDPALLTDGYWAAELPGILNRALAARDRLAARGRFELPPDCRQALDEHRAASNPARQFLLESYRADNSPTAFAASREMYEKYKEWCKQNGYLGVLPKNVFGREVPKVFPNAVSKIQPIFTVDTRGWAGISEMRGPVC
jgi:P4 family phage/plasmid primase-like protien